MKRTAVILFNLGGPDSLDAVRPFLFNLFRDPAIIRLPGPLRYLVAWLISSRRDKTAKEIYSKLGGRSPILPNTENQAGALESLLNTDAAKNYKCFIAMRYWHPFADETAKSVRDYAPDDIILLPLYPQFSTTTTASSLLDWEHVAKKAGLNVPTKTMCCYPTDRGFIGALSQKIRAAYDTAPDQPRILFSAHGLPEKIVKSGDPYQWQCEETTKALVASLNIPDLDYVTCYQSRVGPLKWIGPSTDDEIHRAGDDKKSIIIVPIAFVSEHSETLVEIDMEYRELAHETGVPNYTYIPTVSADADFIAGLASLVRQTEDSNKSCQSHNGGRLCPHGFSGCCMR
jgi:ferrochelatase